MSARVLTAAVCQLHIREEAASNLERAEAMLCAARDKGAQLALLPEMFMCPYEPEAIRAAAEPENGPTTRRLAALASELGLLVGATVAERSGGGHIYNTGLVFAPNGDLLGRQLKNHLFDVNIPGRVCSEESAVITPGTGVEVFAWQGLSLAVNICFDIRFPAMAREASRRGAHVLCVPAQFSAGTAPDHWELLLRARAVDYQMFVIGANAAYDAKAAYQSWGRSMIVDPWGDVLVRAGAGEEIIIAKLDFARLKRVRQEMPVENNRGSHAQDDGPG